MELEWRRAVVKGDAAYGKAHHAPHVAHVVRKRPFLFKRRRFRSADAQVEQPFHVLLVLSPAEKLADEGPVDGGKRGCGRFRQ